MNYDNRAAASGSGVNIASVGPSPLPRRDDSGTHMRWMRVAMEMVSSSFRSHLPALFPRSVKLTQSCLAWNTLAHLRVPRLWSLLFRQKRLWQREKYLWGACSSGTAKSSPKRGTEQTSFEMQVSLRPPILFALKRRLGVHLLTDSTISFFKPAGYATRRVGSDR